MEGGGGGFTQIRTKKKCKKTKGNLLDSHRNDNAPFSFFVFDPCQERGSMLSVFGAPLTLTRFFSCSFFSSSIIMFLLSSSTRNRF